MGLNVSNCCRETYVPKMAVIVVPGLIRNLKDRFNPSASGREGRQGTQIPSPHGPIVYRPHCVAIVRRTQRCVIRSASRYRRFADRSLGTGKVKRRSFDYTLARLANNASRKISGERSAQDDNSTRVRRTMTTGNRARTALLSYAPPESALPARLSRVARVAIAALSLSVCLTANGLSS
jgi:hypothetical protein